jgi:hypothetical protein
VAGADRANTIQPSEKCCESDTIGGAFVLAWMGQLILLPQPR